MDTRLIARFWSKVAVSDDCWEWTASRFRGGYGRFTRAGEHVMAHRFSYELRNGYIDPNLMVLHKCDNKGCVNPDHLYQGDAAQNAKDALQRGRIPAALKTECVRGHAYTPENTGRSPKYGRRYCLTCDRMKSTKHPKRGK